MKVLIAYYSRYGHTFQMARAVKEGVMSVSGVEAVLRRIQEFPDIEKDIDKDKYAKQVWEQQKDIPVCMLDDLREADGVIFGTPTRYGNMTAQMKRFVDSTAELWMAGALEDTARFVGLNSPIVRATVDKYTEDIAVDSRRIQAHDS